MGIGRGFVSGLAQGVALGNTVMDTYDRYKLKNELENAGKIDQETVNGKLSEYDQSTADHVNNPENGYEVQKLDNGGLKFRTAGSDNSWNEVNPTGKQYKLGNKVQDTEFTKEQIARARTDAQANVYMQNGDPMKGYGLKSLAREERKGQQWEDINQNQINDLQALAEGRYDSLRSTIDKGVERYNNASSGPYADGHRISIDWNKNEAIVTGPKNEVVKTIPINQQSAAQFIRSYYDDLRSAANPEYGLKAREVGTKEFSANTEYEFKRPGGTWENAQKLDRDTKIRAAEIGAGGRNHFVPLSDGYKYNQNDGNYYDIDGKRVTDKDELAKVTKLGGKAPTEWTYNSDQTSRSTKDGITQKFDSSANQWVTVGQPAVSQAAAAVGVRSDVDKSTGAPAFLGANKQWYSTEQEAVKSFSDAKEAKKESPAAAPAGAQPTSSPAQPAATNGASYNQINSAQIGQNNGFVPRRGEQPTHSRSGFRASQQEQKVVKAQAAVEEAQAAVAYDKRSGDGRVSPYNQRKLADAVAAYERLTK